MVPRNNHGVEPAGRKLVMTRIFDAPRDLVFQAWKDLRHVAQWWGPNDFTNPICELDVRPGGLIRIDMRGPNGIESAMTGVFHEIVVPERIVFTTSAFADAMRVPQLEVRNTVTFAERDGKTTLTLQVVVIKATPAVAPTLDWNEVGWGQSFDRLAEMLATLQ